jgi:hypothetical protein
MRASALNPIRRRFEVTDLAALPSGWAVAAVHQRVAMGYQASIPVQRQRMVMPQNQGQVANG